MKVRVKVIEETVYEVDMTFEEYCNIRTTFSSADDFHDRVLTTGKIYDLSRTWNSIEPTTQKDEKDLLDFLD